MSRTPSRRKWAWCYARPRSLAGSSSRSGHQDGRLWKCNSPRRWGRYRSVRHSDKPPSTDGFREWWRQAGTRWFPSDIQYSGFRCPYRGIQWCRRRSGTTCGHGENRYTCHVRAAPCRSFRSDAPGTNRRQKPRRNRASPPYRRRYRHSRPGHAAGRKANECS